MSIGIGCHIGHATEMVYADGLDVTRPDLAVPIGIGCRICPRLDCGQRAHPPADHRFTLDESSRAEDFYSGMAPDR